jgi:hypothetical protein
VRSRYLLRALISTSTQIIESAYAAEDSVENIVDRAEQLIFDIAERSDLKTFMSVADIIPRRWRTSTRWRCTSVACRACQRLLRPRPHYRRVPARAVHCAGGAPGHG